MLSAAVTFDALEAARTGVASAAVDTAEAGVDAAIAAVDGRPPRSKIST